VEAAWKRTPSGKTGILEGCREQAKEATHEERRYKWGQGRVPGSVIHRALAGWSPLRKTCLPEALGNLEKSPVLESDNIPFSTCLFGDSGQVI
jgi:hypothetical protein